MNDQTNTGVEFLDDDDVIERTFLPADNRAGKDPVTAKQLLRRMISRQKHLGSPLPDGFVAPPGIDLDALLKQLPPQPDLPPTA